MQRPQKGYATRHEAEAGQGVDFDVAADVAAVLGRAAESKPVWQPGLSAVHPPGPWQCHVWLAWALTRGKRRV